MCIRDRYCKAFRGHGADYGKCPSKKETYYGYKVHALITLEAVSYTHLNIITTIMKFKGKVNTDTIKIHKGELMEYKNQTENRAFQEMLQAAVKRLQNRSGEDIAAKSGAVFHSSRNVLEVLSFYETIEIQLPEFCINSDMDEWHYLTLLHYLDMADGTEGSQKLITFGNLKDGLIRGTKFDRTAEQKLEKLLQDKEPEKIQKACTSLGAEFTETKADLCAVFPVLPRYPVTLKI